MKTIIKNLQNSCSIVYPDKGLPDIDFEYSDKHDNWEIKKKDAKEITTVSNITDISLPFYNLFINADINKMSGDVRNYIPKSLIEKVPDELDDICYRMSFSMDWTKENVQYAYIRSKDDFIDIFYIDSDAVKLHQYCQNEIQYIAVDIYKYIDLKRAYEKKYSGLYRQLGTDTPLDINRTRCLCQEDLGRRTMFYYNYNEDGVLNSVETVMRCGFTTLSKIYPIEYKKNSTQGPYMQTAEIPFMFYLTFEKDEDAPILYQEYENFSIPVMVKHQMYYEDQKCTEETFTF